MNRLLKLAIFDMDGLLFDTERLFMEKKNEILTEYGYPARQEDYVQTIGLGGDALSEKLTELYGEAYPADEISQKTREAVDRHINQYGPVVKPGIRELLARLSEKDIACCVASSTDRMHVAHYVRLAGLNESFSFLVGGDEVMHSKPAPDIFLKACHIAGVSPEEAIVFEDSENGIYAAAAAEIPVICIPDLKEPSPEAARLAKAVLASPDGLVIDG